MFHFDRLILTRHIVGRLTLLAMNHRRNDLSNRQSVFLRELEIAFIVGRHAHHRARAVIHQHVIRDPNRQQLAVERIDGQLPGIHAELLFFCRLVFSFDRARRFDLFSKLQHVVFQRRAFEQLRQNRVLSRDHDRSRAKDRVDASGEHTDLFLKIFDSEIDIRAFAATHPIALALDDFFRPAAFNLFDVLRPAPPRIS